MGFKIGQSAERRAVLAFTGDYEGAEVTVRLNVPLGVFLEAEKVQKTNEWGGFLDYFVENVIRGWNLEDGDGKPVPVSREGLAQVPLDLLMRVMTEWAQAVGGISGPLGSRLSNGAQSVEASLPMASS